MPKPRLPRARPSWRLQLLLMGVAVLVLGRVALTGPTIFTLTALAAVGAALVLSIGAGREL